MHHTVSYKHLAGEEKRKKAVDDIKEWLGTRRFNAFVRELKGTAPMSPSQFRLILSFAGIGGYPVQALYETLWPQAQWSEEDAA